MIAQESRDACWFTERLPEPDALAEMLGDDPVFFTDNGVRFDA